MRTSVIQQFMTHILAYPQCKNYRCGNYDCDDENSDTCDDYDPEEDIDMMFDEETRLSCMSLK